MKSAFYRLRKELFEASGGHPVERAEFEARLNLKGKLRYPHV